MSIAVGDKLPDATFRFLSADGPQETTTADLFGGKKVALFGLPGAFTGTCTTAHLPSFMRVEGKLRDKGVDAVICLSVNDIFVMSEWGKSTGADQTGLMLIADTEAAFTKAIGMDFTAPPVGLIDRSKRYSMIVEDGVVKTLNAEASPGECEISAGETLLDQL